MNGHTMPGILFVTAIGCLALVLLTSSLSADIVPVQTRDGGMKHYIPVYDAVQYQSQQTVEKEMIDDGNAIYVKRPYGYIESRTEGEANISIIKTSIDRISTEKAVIRGEIKNLDDKTIDLIVITFNLYNADGKQIGNAYASIDYLSPRTTWKFVTDPIDRSDFQFERYGSIYIGMFD